MTKTLRFRRFEPVPTIFILAATATLVGLGAWQLQRLSYKQALIARFEQAQALPPLERLPEDAAELRALEFRQVRLHGRFLDAHTFRKVGVYPTARTGYYLVTPFMPDGSARAILVNRGFAPGEAGQALPTEGEAEAEITGILRAPRERRAFSPENQPERNVWFFEDMPYIEQKAGVTLAPLVVEATGPTHNDKLFPNTGALNIRNDHLGYAITWFLTALAGVAMFLAYHWEKPKKGEGA